MRKTEAATTLSILALFVAVLIFLVFHGRSARVYLEKPAAVAVAEPFNAYEIWEQEGVRGRILLLFDRKLNADTGGGPLSRDNYVYWAIWNNMVRKIYHVIPDSSWGEVEAALTGRDDVVAIRDGFRANIEGTPIYILRIRHIPPIRERVIMSLNGDIWSEKDLLSILEKLRSNWISSDSVVISGKFSDNNLQKIMNVHAPSL